MISTVATTGRHGNRSSTLRDNAKPTLIFMFRSALVTLLQLRGARSATQVSHMQVEMLNLFMHFRFSSRAAMLGKKTLKGQ